MYPRVLRDPNHRPEPRDTPYPVRADALLLGGFGGLVLLLASVGLDGAVSYSVSRRPREIGIRMALGAAGRDVVTLVTRQGVRMVLVGVALERVGTAPWSI